MSFAALRAQATSLDIYISLGEALAGSNSQPALADRVVETSKSTKVDALLAEKEFAVDQWLKALLVPGGELRSASALCVAIPSTSV